MAELNALPPPTWVDIVDSDKANKWIDDNVKPIQEAIDGAYAFLISIFETLSEGLDFVSSLLIDITDPISLILNKIIKVIKTLLQDLRNAGFYITWDSAFKTLPNFSKFSGGYGRVSSELTKKLTDPQDTSRPQFSPFTSVITLTAYVDLGVTDAGFDAKAFAQKGKTGFAALDAFLNLFSVTRTSSNYLPPLLLKPVLFAEDSDGDAYALDSNLIKVDTNIVGFSAVWQSPPSKKLNFFDVDLPPGSYVVTVTTRAKPLDLYVELPLERTSSPSGVSTVISPVYFQKEKQGDSTGIATTLVAPRIRDVSDSLFVKYNGEKVPYTKFTEETKSFYYNTFNLGVVFGSSEYSLDLKFDELPTKLYDLDKGEYTDNIETYYIYVSSHTDEVKAYSDKSEVTLGETSGTDLDYVLRKDEGANYLSTSSGKPPPPFSSPSTASRKSSEKIKFVRALRESLLMFMLAEEYFHKSPSNPLDIPRVTDSDRAKIYSLFWAKDAKSLYDKYDHDRDDVNSFRDELEDEVKDAVTTFLGRGTPSKKVLSSFESDIDTILNEDDFPLIYPTLDLEYREEDDFESQYGLFPDRYLGLEERLDKEADVQDFLSEDSGRIVRPLQSFGDTDCSFFYREGEKPESMPSLLFNNASLQEKYSASVRLLGLTLTEPDNASAQGEWIFLRFFADGLPSVEQFLESILAAVKSLVFGINGIIDAIKRYIALLQQRIASIRAFVARLKALLDAILSIRLPGGLRYLLAEADGTEGLISAFNSADNQPPSGQLVYSTYATFVFGGLPSIFVDFLLSLISDQSTIDQVNEVFTGNKDGETDNQIFLGVGNDGGGSQP